MALGKKFDPYIIAEIGVNYEGSMARAKQMIEEVAVAGGHAAKFQSYKAEKIASPDNSHAYWDTNKEKTKSQYELFKKFDSFDAPDYIELAKHCELVGIDFLSTPFDLDIVPLLAPFMPAIKVASADITNIPLLKEISKTGKPVIMSTGAASFDEVETALDILENHGVQDITLLHCVLNYPTSKDKANLRGIEKLVEVFGTRAQIGYSDHVSPEEDGSVPALQTATLLGATVIEKHFTDDRNAPGNDHYHSFDKKGLSSFTSWLSDLNLLLGTGTPDLSSQAQARENARRRIFSRKKIPAGKIIEETDLIPLRSNVGINISLWESVVGAETSIDIEPHVPIQDSHLLILDTDAS